ncbi:hypothetical protein OIU76_002109 [Salix suchowensis]|nr:hypothetical protein OIU76_002109 [Salix suchowensis]
MVEKVEPVKVPIDGGALEGTLLGEGCLRDINEKEKTVDHSNMSETKRNPTDTMWFVPHEHETQRCIGNKVAFFQSRIFPEKEIRRVGIPRWWTPMRPARILL